MTNEEKANNIVIDIGLSAIKDSINGREEQDTLELIRQSVLKMAEWKDRQIQEIIDKEIDRANRYHDNKLSRTQITASIRVVSILSEYLGKEFPKDRFHFGFATMD